MARIRGGLGKDHGDENELSMRWGGVGSEEWVHGPVEICCVVDGVGGLVSEANILGLSLGGGGRRRRDLKMSPTPGEVHGERRANHELVKGVVGMYPKCGSSRGSCVKD